VTLLAIDVGNTNTVFGFFNEESGDDVIQWRAQTQIHRTGDEWFVALHSFLECSQLEQSQLSGIVIGSVVPDVTTALRRVCTRLNIDPLVVTWKTDIGIGIRIDDPREAGADRLANAVAAFHIYGGPSIVADLGTATTLDVIASDGAYVGGVIMPGIQISLDALYGRAAALRQVELTAPRSVIGTGTVSAVQSGATFGYAAQVDGLCEQIEKEVGVCHVISTGGLAGVITPLSQRIQHHDPTLTLQGLRLIYDRNNK
jgi:type III pantothenate kinase